MKRFIMAATAILLIVGSLSLLPGCGNDSGKAKEYMESGDDIVSKLQANSEELATQMTEIGNDLSNGTMTSSSQLEEKAEEYEISTEELIGQAEDAKAEYKKILNLNGVGDYIKYAKLGIDLVDTAASFLKEMNRLLQETLDYMKKAESGTLTEADDAAYKESMNKAQVNIETETNKAKETADKMKELKKDKDL